jgi:hypothetical protein
MASTQKVTAPVPTQNVTAEQHWCGSKGMIQILELAESSPILSSVAAE